MSKLIEKIATLQAEYDRLDQIGREQFGSKARLLLEKKLREEMKKRLDSLGGDIEEFKKDKARLAHALREARAERRAQIEADVAGGKMDPEEARKEIVALGWEIGVADAAIATALKQQPRDVQTLAMPGDGTEEEEVENQPDQAIETQAQDPQISADDQDPQKPEQVEPVQDPVGASQPVTQKVEYTDPNPPQEPPKRRRK